MSVQDAAAIVIGPNGEAQSFGTFLRAQKKACGLPVTKIVEAAGISRANYYLLEKDRQRPTLPTVVSLLTAMGLTTRVPTAEDSERARDLVVQAGQDVYMVDLRWSNEERRRSRERYRSAASIGLEAALGGLAGARAARGPAAGLGAAGPPLVVSAAVAGAIVAAADRLAERRAADRAEAERAPKQEDVLADLNQAAEAMTTEELEAVLAAMRAMREAGKRARG